MKQIHITTDNKIFINYGDFINFANWKIGGYNYFNIFSRTNDLGELTEFLTEDCSIKDMGVVGTVNNLLEINNYDRCLFLYYITQNNVDSLRLIFCNFLN
jgi:hypothetical protein